MFDTSTFTPLRFQLYRLAWLSAHWAFGVAGLMIFTGHPSNDAMSGVGLGLCAVAALLSIFSRAWPPFVWAFMAFVLVGAAICA